MLYCAQGSFDKRFVSEWRVFESRFRSPQDPRREVLDQWGLWLRSPQYLRAKHLAQAARIVGVVVLESSNKLFNLVLVEEIKHLSQTDLRTEGALGDSYCEDSTLNLILDIRHTGRPRTHGFY